MSRPPAGHVRKCRSDGSVHVPDNGTNTGEGRVGKDKAIIPLHYHYIFRDVLLSDFYLLIGIISGK
jgi:hypothetical protein